MSNAIRCETKRGRWRAQRWELYRRLGHQEAPPRRTAEICGSTTTVSNSGRFPDRLHLAHPRKAPPRTRDDHRPNFSSHAARTPRWSCGRLSPPFSLCALRFLAVVGRRVDGTRARCARLYTRSIKISCREARAEVEHEPSARSPGARQHRSSVQARRESTGDWG